MAIVAATIDVHSRFFFTYRRDFAPLAPSSLRTDAGWGCVHRAGQMLLAEALVRHRLGRAWRWDDANQPASDEERQIVKLFEDTPSKAVPYSIHNICQVGAEMFALVGLLFLFAAP